MPTYQYSCTDCGHFLEQFQSFSEDSLTVCPECQGRLRKVFNAVGVVFKGSGFYRTDSRAGGDGAKGGDSGTSEKAASTAGSKADTGSSSGTAPGSTSGGTSSSSSAGSGASAGSAA